MKYSIIFFLVIIFVSTSCIHNNDIPKPETKDYFPCRKNMQWIYVDDEGNLSYQTALGDTIIDQLKYQIMGGEPNNTEPGILIRKEGNKYFSRLNIYGIFHPEKLFLQTDLSIGNTWKTIISSIDYEVYTIVAIDKERSIGGITYSETIEVKTDNFTTLNNNDQLNYSTTRIFANNIGVVSLATTNLRKSILKEFIK